MQSSQQWLAAFVPISCHERKVHYVASLAAHSAAKVAHHRLAVFIKQDVSRLKITVKNSLAMGIGNRARNFCHQSHTLARVHAECWRSGAKATAGRVFHAEKRQPLLAFADLVNGK